MLAVLSQIELFRSFSTEGLARLAGRSRSITFAPGSLLVRQGDARGILYVIVAGRVRVERWHPQLTEPVVLTELGPGDVIGEVGMLDDEPSATSVTATEEVCVAELSAAAVTQVLLRQAEAAPVLLQTFSRHLRTIDELATRAAQRGWNRTTEAVDAE